MCRLALVFLDLLCLQATEPWQRQACPACRGHAKLVREAPAPAPAMHCSASAAPVRRGGHTLTSHMLMQALHKLHHCTCPRAACCIDAPALRMGTARAHVMQHTRTAHTSDPRRLPRTASAKQAMPSGRLSVKPARDVPREVIEWLSASLTCTVAWLLSVAALL